MMVNLTKYIKNSGNIVVAMILFHQEGTLLVCERWHIYLAIHDQQYNKH